MKKELAIMEKLGDAIMSELETAEQEVCTAWGKSLLSFTLKQVKVIITTYNMLLQKTPITTNQWSTVDRLQK